MVLSYFILPTNSSRSEWYFYLKSSFEMLTYKSPSPFSFSDVLESSIIIDELPLVILRIAYCPSMPICRNREKKLNNFSLFLCLISSYSIIFSSRTSLPLFYCYLSFNFSSINIFLLERYFNSLFDMSNCVNNALLSQGFW